MGNVFSTQKRLANETTYEHTRNLFFRVIRKSLYFVFIFQRKVHETLLESVPMLKEITVSFFLQEICEPGAIRMRVPECQFNFLRILKMRNKILVHFHFSFLWKIENDFSTHFSKLIFYFFVKTKMKSFRFLFSNFRKK